jgi:hypothetical protein
MFQPFAPLAVFQRHLARAENSFLPASTGVRAGVRCRNQCLRKFTAQPIHSERGWIGHNGGNSLVQIGLVAAAENAFADEICRAPGGFTEGNP